MKVSIICPLYNAEKYLIDLYNNIITQKINQEVELLFVLTESKDKSENILQELKLKYEKVKPEEFSHSRTREFMASKATGDIIVFISQDVIMKNKHWLNNLVKPIIQGECEASFSRQLCSNSTIEKYIREKNYPEVSRIVSKDDIERLGLITFFYSDASSAVKASIYRELNGYDGKDLIINEDMYFANKLIHAGYRIKYCSDSQVYHSHIFTLKQLFNRYFDTGVFFKQNPCFLTYKTNESGMNLVKHALKRSLMEKNFKIIFSIIPNFGARFIGSALGKRYDKLSIKKRVEYSLNKKYWSNHK